VSARKRNGLRATTVICLMLAPLVAVARPVVLQEVARLTSPDPAYRLTSAIALDGNDLLVVGALPERIEQQPVVLFHFERQSDGSWLSRGAIASTPDGPYKIQSIVLEGGLGMFLVGGYGFPTLLERTSTGWKTTPWSDFLPHFVASEAAIDGRKIAVGSLMQVHLLEQDATGAWVITRTLPAPEGECCDDFFGPDIEFVQNEGIAGARGQTDPPGPQTFVFDRVQGQWSRTATLPGVFGTIVVDARIALRLSAWNEPGDVLSFFTRAADRSWTVRHALLTDEWFADKRPGTVLVEGNLAYAAAGRDDARGRDAGSISVYSRATATPMRFRHSATLVASDASAGAQLGYSIFVANLAASGRRVAALGASAPDPAGARTETIYVFELPNPLPAVARVQDTFEDLNSAGWTPWGFTNWSVVSWGGTHVFRQTNTQGDARAIFEGFQGGNQSIQADLKVNAFAGTTTHWAGLMARYTDSRNFYYLMHDANTLQIRKIVNGVFTPIASTPFTLQVGRKYRFRLETVGTWLRAYVNDRLMLTVRDTAHSAGRTGLTMWKANAEYDNVVMTSSPYTTLHADSFNGTDDEKITPPWVTSPANAWARATTGAGAQVFKQSVANGDARAVHGAPTNDQIVTADIRPTSFHATGGWAGLTARYVDTKTYYYAFLQSSGKVSLRRWMNGQITVLDEAPFTVTAGTSYRVRLEAIGSYLRLYVNGQFVAEAVDSAIAQGRYGLVTYRAAAEFDNFNASRP
jgi:hypothetical protein